PTTACCYTLSLHDALPIFGQAGHDAAQRADDAVGTLDVTAQPEQVVGSAAGEIAAAATQLDGLHGRAQETERADRPGRQHPRVLDRKSTRLNSSHQIISYA